MTDADPFILDFDPAPGVADEVAPGVRRVLAPNASPMTFRGTNTYLVGTEAVAIIDPGPGDAGHLEAILAAVGPEARVSHVVVTHAHSDHSTLAPALARATGAPICGFGPPGAGRAPDMERMAAEGALGGGEGVDEGFAPDILLGEGDVLEGPGWRLEALWTPGHFAGHLSFALADAGVLFSGDAVMSWSTTLVSPPDGDLTAFMAAMARLQQRDDRLYLPGHGAPLPEPGRMLAHQIAHRQAREAQILAALAAGPDDAAGLAGRIYTGLAPALLPMAARNVLAHLIDLARRELVTPEGGLSAAARFRRL
ncbi:MAG: MBL fold metallo-hydrolase [Rhodobacteraceae bacterium]|nr:MBL fold metallo-hydrolase [Paracoccaceae bacterium]